MSGCVDRKLLLPISHAARGIRPSAAAVLFRTIPSSVSTNLDIPEQLSFCVRIHLYLPITIACRPGRSRGYSYIADISSGSTLALASP